MKILVINAGSSSLKYQVIDMNNEQTLGKGTIERIGVAGSEIKNHTDALKIVMAEIVDKGYIKNVSEISAIGHRVLHAAEDYSSSMLITDEVMAVCERNAVLGPLHQPANLACVKSCQETLPNVPNVAVFDTVFHASIPRHAFMYAIDYEDYKKYKVRRYGFHGTSHKYVSGEAVKYLKQKSSKVITCHLGNGSSLAAVVNGKCVDTSMGLTPLEGMIMGTRSGDADPAVVTFLAQQKGISAEEVISYLNKKCGLLGIAGVSDFRDLEAKAYKENDERANLAIDMFAYRIKKYIGSYYASMGGLDAIVFTGGIGENSNVARAKICEGLECLGIKLDKAKNANAPRGKFSELHEKRSAVKIVIIPTNEELVIARDSKEVIEGIK
ncbi:MAG: acetate kinase [Firmicutes bacterium]|nr:acetate kinase [Bacillota bacterium]